MAISIALRRTAGARFLIDYEGIGGDGAYRPELCLMVFITLEGEGGPARELQVTAAVT